MLGILIFSAIAAYAILGIGNAIDKLGKMPSHKSYEPTASRSIPVLWLEYGEFCENYNTPIDPISPHNLVSEIVRENGIFSVTIENSITKDKKTISNKDKWNLCQEADDVAFQFAVKEREEYHTL